MACSIFCETIILESVSGTNLKKEIKLDITEYFANKVTGRNHVIIKRSNLSTIPRTVPMEWFPLVFLRNTRGFPKTATPATALWNIFSVRSVTIKLARLKDNNSLIAIVKGVRISERRKNVSVQYSLPT